MKNNLIKSQFFWLVIIIVIQVLIVNKFLVYLNSNLLIPLYVIPILKLPINTNKYLVLVYVFFIGLIIDFFCITPGLHSFIMVFIGFLRLYILDFLASKEKTSKKTISIELLGVSLYIIYISLMYFVFFILFTLLEYFQISSLLYTIKTILVNTIINVLLLLCIEYSKKGDKYTK